MRKTLMLLGLVCVMLFAVQITNAASELYNVRVSTLPNDNPVTFVPEINDNKVWVKQIVIYNDSDTAQTVTVYINATSTSAATVKMTIPVPATRGMYYPLNPALITNAMGNFDVINFPYVVFRTDAPNGKACYLTLVYGL
jgi:hypothetical protein